MPEPRNETTPPAAPKNRPIVFDHPLFRHARAIASGAGIVAGLAVALFADTPWWMPLLAFAVVASVLFRILRPQMHAPSIEDEL